MDLVTRTPSLPAELRQVAAYVDASLAPATRRAYGIGLADFRAWCSAQGLEALPAAPETVARYLAGWCRLRLDVDLRLCGRLPLGLHDVGGD